MWIEAGGAGAPRSRAAARCAGQGGAARHGRGRGRAVAALALACWIAALAAALPSAAAAQGAGSRAAGVPARAAQADDRGRALYEARCGGCHDRSVHQRSARSATDFAAVRAAVVRWDRETGALWRGDEIDAVARYLNERYYRFPCQGPACPAPRADNRR